jgi:hypothetical protein
MCAGGCVKIVKTGDPAKDAWIAAYLAELLAFPGSPVNDQVDASTGAFAALQLLCNNFVPQGDIGGPPISTGVDYGPQNCIDDIGRNPDSYDRSYDGNRDESNDGYGDSFNVRGSLF